MATPEVIGKAMARQDAKAKAIYDEARTVRSHSPTGGDCLPAPRARALRGNGARMKGNRENGLGKNADQVAVHSGDDGRKLPERGHESDSDNSYQQAVLDQILSRCLAHSARKQRLHSNSPPAIFKTFLTLVRERWLSCEAMELPTHGNHYSGV